MSTVDGPQCLRIVDPLLDRMARAKTPVHGDRDRGAMRVLAVGRPRSGIDPRSAIAPHAVEELEALWQLYASGTVREMYSPGGPGAVLMLEAESITAAQAVLDALPLVANQIVDFELIELRPFLSLAALFIDRELS